MDSSLDRLDLDLSSCDTGTNVVLGVICAVALVVSFSGYRLYKAVLGLLAFLLAAAIEGAIGSAWIAKSPDHQVAKKIIVAAFCVLWGVMGAWICKKLADKLHHFLGFVFGAAVGAAAVGAIIQIIDSAADIKVDSGYLGWQEFAFFTVGIPVAVLVGYLSKDCVKYFLMVASAIMGAYIAVRSFTAILACAKVDPEDMASPTINFVAIVVI